ncbi:hypothetical protein BRADI_3g31517v3 [Brachypodium distachyon]|uniref:Uncharacterized protein n=1 Tax=Brachypodium distachyon TaxID=15368 RepID=A0A2K2D0E0_BRADI|nr:hypothetical protein BRADI_3g31517v3 [Brachypodium distachyon]
MDGSMDGGYIGAVHRTKARLQIVGIWRPLRSWRQTLMKSNPTILGHDVQGRTMDRWMCARTIATY